ncbi:hypothetical protein EJ03DRAFT_350260 [Teratosphaeria nubilosa]|uniref:Uncharacterized protein n=1 Tax=Teratosphaeria nubilosa TaxID=161662 RepID=A0A6G1LE17_9PEZI|nr:hypothetical protein EJ03DRAFT_350260 [Teratosphaeria nubilosa]
MKLITALSLAVTCLRGIAHGQFILGAIALMEIVVEIMEAEAVVAEIAASTDLAITGEIVAGEELGAETSLSLTAEEVETGGSLTFRSARRAPQEVAHTIGGQLGGITARADGTTSIAAPYRMDIDPMILDSRTITEPITFESTFTARVAARNRGVPGGAQASNTHFAIVDEALEGVRISTNAGRFSARLRDFSVNMLRASA